MNLSERNIDIEITDDLIKCNQEDPFGWSEWNIRLLEDRLIFSKKRKETVFLIYDVKEFEFEMEGGDTRKFPHTHDRAVAYVVLKSDPDPQDFFSFNAWQEEYALSSKTKTYEFCNEIMKFISSKYSIPYSYKISIETKKKNNRLGLIIVIIILQVLAMMLVVYTHRK
ncbi:hypothetical protein [Mucilaginibacter sp. BT774]|uniref:hypothetical protein n=1 Tax=Mucilaginibacter sp. BT774 TaxID=3062276 RepID=UPI0026762936|nr:hypothetical protein [Mucilaginibacter sp. BT774]MDO3626608.1 hypothetical protein [Mucilaginibacter sp. BT774]